MGTLDREGNVVATRYTPRATPTPPVTNAVPYVPLAYPGTPPSPWKLVPQPLKITVAHTELNRGGTGTITLTASNVSDEPTDGSTITLADRVPTGLTVTSNRRHRLDLHRHDAPRRHAGGHPAAPHLVPAGHDQRERVEHRELRAQQRTDADRPRRQ